MTGAADLGLDDVETAANIVMEAANPEANIIFGATFSEDFEDEMRVTVIATGFDEKKPESKGIYSSSKPAAGSKQQSIPADAASDINDIERSSRSSTSKKRSDLPRRKAPGEISAQFAVNIRRMRFTFTI